MLVVLALRSVVLAFVGAFDIWCENKRFWLIFMMGINFYYGIYGIRR